MDWKNYAVCLMDLTIDRHWRCACLVTMMAAGCTFFRGELPGSIAAHPRGDSGFGWDKIFCPDGYNGRTRAELSPEEDAATYHIIKPIAAVSEFLQTHK